MRTIAYLTSLSDKNIEGQCNPMRMQDTVLLELVDAEVELVYSSRIMNDEIKERIGQISTQVSSRWILRQCVFYGMSVHVGRNLNINFIRQRPIRCRKGVGAMRSG